MYQNIIEEKKQNKKAGVLSNVFSVRNIGMYIISFMLSMVSLGGDFSIFSISILGASFASDVPALGIIAVSLIGTSIKFGIGGLTEYFVTAMVLTIILTIVKPIYNESEKNEKIKIGIHVFVAILVVQVIKLFMSNLTLYDMLASLTIAIIGFAFYKIFVNSTNVLQDFWIRKAYTIEELIGASLMLAISLGALGDINILGFGIRNILSILIVMVLGWKNGILVGTTTGVTIGVTMRCNNRNRANNDCSLCNIWNDGRCFQQIWETRCDNRICIRKYNFSLCIKWIHN